MLRSRLWKLTGRTASIAGSFAGLAVLAALAATYGCVQATGGNAVELVFTYGSEKESWLGEATKSFNDQGLTTKSGKRIRVQGIAVGSGELIDEPLKERRKSHLVSPASGAYIELGNAASQKQTGKPLVDPARIKNLVYSPVVIAMWRPMAEALGWPSKQIGWADVHNLAQNPKGWEAVGRGQWGPFRFAHTHPEFSNSGLIAILAQAYAGAGKTSGLTVEDVRNPKVAEYLRVIQQSVVHYGSSTGFFHKRMTANPLNYLNAAVLYENLVIESNLAPHKGKLAAPLVAIYPKEGTFWCDHPVGIVERPWVTEEHREAAALYISFLMDRPQQLRAMQHGFRPGDERIELAEPVTAANGIDPREPRLLLRVPPAEVMQEILDLWKANKKPSRVVLVMDTSGSMNRDQRLLMAKDGALQLVKMLGSRDTLSLLTFSSKSTWAHKDVLMNDEGKKRIADTVQSLLAQGETAVYDAVEQGFNHLLESPRPELISAVVVLTDGEDNRSRRKVEDLIQHIAGDNETKTIRVFTIAYGGEANGRILQKIAEATQAKSYTSDPRQIFEVFKDIATFF